MEGLNDIRTAISSENIKLHCNLQKETRGSGFCWRRVYVQEHRQKGVYVDYGATAVIPQKLQLSSMEI